MPDFSSFRPAPKTRRTPNLYAPQQPQGYSDREVDMWNAQRGMGVMQENIARAGGGTPTTRRTGSSSTSQTGVISAGEKVTRVQRGDGSIIPVAAVTGDSHLIRPKGSANIYVSPSTGERFKPDPASPMGLSSIGTARAEALAKQAEKDAKLATKQAVADEKEAIRQENDRREAAFAAEGRPSYTDAHGRIQPKQSDEAWEATKKKKQAGKQQANEYLKDGRRFYTDKITGLPVPMTSDEEHARNKAEKMAKIQKDAAERPHKQRLDVLKAELSNPDLKVSDKDLKDADEALTAASAPLMALRGTDDFVTPITDEELRDMLKDADPAKKAAANAYLNARENVGKLAKAEAQRKALEQEVYKTNLRIADPDKYAEELKAEAPAKSAEELKAHAAEIEERIKARAAEHKAETDRIKAKDDELSAQHALTKERYDQALAKGEAPAVIGTLGDSLNDLEEQMTQWESESQDQRAAVNAQAEEINKDAANLKILGDEEKRRADEQQQKHVEQLDAALPGAGKRYGDTVADVKKRAQDLRDKYPDPSAPEAKAAFEALQKDFKEKVGAITKEAEAEATKQAEAGKALYDEFGKDYQADWSDPEASDNVTSMMLVAAEKHGLTEKQARYWLSTYAQSDWDRPSAVGKGSSPLKHTAGEDAEQEYRVLPNGNITVNPGSLLDKEEYERVVKSAPVSREAKEQALKVRQQIAPELAEKSIATLRSNDKMAEWLDKNTSGTDLERMEQFTAKMKAGGWTTAAMYRFASSLANMGASWTGAAAAATGSDTFTQASVPSLLSSSWWKKRAEQFDTAAGTAEKGTNLLGKYAAMAVGGIPSVAESMVAGNVAGGVLKGAAALKGAYRLAKAGVQLKKGLDYTSIAAKAGGLSDTALQTAGVSGAALDAAIQQGGSTYVDAYDKYLKDEAGKLAFDADGGNIPKAEIEAAKGRARMMALKPAILDAAQTAALTALGGAKGTEAIFRKGGKESLKEGVKKSFGKKLGELGLDIGEEALEEYSNQFVSGVIAQATYEPEKTIKQIFEQAFDAGIVGGVLGGLGGGMKQFGEYREGKNKASDQPPAPDLGPAPTPSILPEQAAANAAAIDNWTPTGALPSSIQDAAKAAHGKAPTPEQHADTARTAAHALVEIAAGQDPRTMSSEVRRALGIKTNSKTGAIEPLSKNVTPLVDSVADEKGNHHPVITDAARAWLAQEVPGAGEAVKLSYSERVEQIKNPPKPAKKPKAAKVDRKVDKTATETAPAVEENVPWQVDTPAAEVSTEPGEMAPAPVKDPGEEDNSISEPKGETPKLPRELASAKPAYSYGEKQFKLEFENDVDRAAYITAQEKPSKRDADFLAFAMQHTGQTEAQVRAHGAAVRAYIKGHAASGTHGDTILIPSQRNTAQQKPQPAEQEKPPRGTTEAPAAPATKPAEPDDRKTEAQGLTGGALINAAETTSQAEVSKLEGEPKKKAVAARDAILAALRRYNGHLPIDLAKGDMGFAYQRGKILVDAARAVKEIARDATSPQNAREMAQKLFDHEIIHFFAVQKVGAERVIEIWDELPDNVREMVQTAYSVKLANADLPPAMLASFAGGHEYFRAMVEATRTGVLSEQVLGTELAAKWKQYLADVLAFLRDLSRQFASIKSEAKRKELMGKVDAIRKEITDALDQFERSITLESNSPGNEPAQAASTGAVSTTGTSSESPVKGSTETVAATDGAGSITNEKESSETSQDGERPINQTVTDNSVTDHPQQAIIKGSTITIRMKVGKKIMAAYSFPLAEWLAAEKGPSANPNWNRREIIKKHTAKFELDEQDGGPSQADRIRDAQSYAIQKALAAHAKAIPAKKPQQSAEKAVKTPKSSTQLTLSRKDAAPVLAFGESIPKAELYDSVDPEWSDGALETDPHVTVLYGLTKHEAAPVAKAIADHGPVTVTLGKMSLFESEDYDVLKIDVESPELRALNAKLSKLPNENSFPDYKPHMTIAYLKKGEGKKYVGNDTFEGQKVTFDTMTFSPPSELRGELGKPELPLSKSKEPSITPPEIKEAAPSLKSEGKFSADDKAEFASLAEGLFQPPSAKVTYKAPIPPAKLGGFITLATKLAEREGDQRVDSPEKVAAFIDEALPGGKARALSDAFWSAIRMTNPSLPAGEVDWQAIYAPKVEDSTAEPDAIRDLILSDDSRAKKAQSMKKLSQERGETLKETQEFVEARLVQIADEVARNGEPAKDRFDELVNIYDKQPLFSARTSTSMENQAYSTPAPMAFVLGHMTGVTPQTSVYDATAGNGMLEIGANLENSVANEIDETRRTGLQQLGVGTITNKDATSPVGAFKDRVKAQVVHLNPPFGGIPNTNFDGYGIRKLEHIISLHALKEGMADNGAAAIILGATMHNQEQSKGAQWVFENYLYGNYHVVDNFEVSGDLYGNQGAKWPVRILVIAGRRSAPLTNQELSPKTVDRLETWGDVWTRAERTRNEVERQRQTLGTDGQPSVPTGSPGGKASAPKPQSVPGGKPSNAPTPAGGSGRGGNSGGQSSSTATGNGSTGLDAGQTSERPENTGTADQSPSGSGKPPATVEGGRGRGTKTTSNAGNGSPTGSGNADTRGENQSDDRGLKRLDRKKAEATATQVPYDPASTGNPFETLVPRGIGEALQSALREIEQNRGPVDQFVADSLDMSLADLKKAMAAEQIDGVAMAIYQMETGGALIIGDETGIGKGRQAASLIRFAILKGKIPVFFTKDPKLFSDMWGDLRDIGTQMSGPNVSASDLSVRPMVLGDSNKAKIRTTDNDVVLKPTSNAKQQKIFAAARDDGFASTGHNAIFATYSQIRDPGARQEFLEWLAANDDIVVILDEAHESAGDGETSMQAAFMMGGTIKRGKGSNKVQITKSGLLNGPGAMHPRGGALYLSATFAKRPDNMPVYFRTDLRRGADNFDQVVAAMSRGGVALQQAITEALAEAGQYTRRERDFTGVSYTMKRVDVGDVTELVRQVDQVTNVLSEIAKFSSLIGSIVKASTAQSNSQIAMTDFASIVHNQVSQLLLSAKADAVVDEIVEAHNRGEKPIVALMNTMESFLDNYVDDLDIKPGNPIKLNWSALLEYALSRSLRASEKLPNGDTEIFIIDPAEHGLGGRYNEVLRAARAVAVDFPVSPIDYIIQKAMASGVKVGELTGRQSGIDYTDFKTGDGTYRKFKVADKNMLVNTFNNGTLAGLLLNASGSTGLSIHASEKFRDQKPRHMIIAQPALDINVFIQMLGRIKRTGMVLLGRYADNSAYGARYSHLTLPLNSEMRPAIMAARKMKSLNANTTGESDSAVKIEAEDLMNRFGNQVVAEYLSRNPELQGELNLDVTEREDGTVEVPQDIARKFTGRMALQTNARQGEAYAEIIADYRRAVEQAKVTGDYDLEIIIHDDWDATKATSEQIVAGTDESSIFTSSVNVQGWDMTDTRPTPSGADMLAEFTKENGSNQQLDTRWQSFSREVDERLDGLEKRTKARLDEARSTLAGLAEEDPGYKAADLAVSMLLRHQGLIAVKKARWRDTQRRLDDIIDEAGKPVMLENAETNEMDHGMMTQIKFPDITGQLRIAPSAFKMTYLLNRPGGRIYPSLASFKADGYTQARSQYSLEDMTGDRGGRRERRTILVGSPIRAYGATGGKGKVVRFKSRDGELITGIMMPRSWGISNLVEDPRKELADADAVVRYINDNPYAAGYVESGESVRIHFNYGRYRISAPSARRTGGDIFLDEELRDIVGDFSKNGQRMTADLNSSDIARAAARVVQITGKRFKGQDLNKVRKANGIVEDSADAKTTRPKSALKEAATKEWDKHIEQGGGTGSNPAVRQISKDEWLDRIDREEGRGLKQPPTGRNETPTRAAIGQTIRRFEQAWKPFFTYSDDTAPKEKRKNALRKIIDQFATPENSTLWKQFAELPTEGLVPEDAERVKEAKELLPYLEGQVLGAPPSGYKTPDSMLAATKATMQGMNKPTAPAFQTKDLHAAYQRAIRGTSTSSASIRSVFDAAKKDQPSLSADEFKSQLKADYYAGLVGLEPSEQASSVEKAGQFTMRDSLGVVNTNMVFMPTTEAEMIDAAERDTTTTPDQILSDWAGTLSQTPNAEPSPGGLSEAEVQKLVRRSNLFWRVHDKRAPFTEKDAISNSIDGTSSKKGFSTFNNADDLLGYWFGNNPAGRSISHYDQQVIVFSGNNVGQGIDGEPLAIPDMKEVHRMTFRDVRDAVNPPVERINKAAEDEGIDRTDFSSPIQAWEYIEADYGIDDAKLVFDAADVAYPQKSPAAESSVSRDSASIGENSNGAATGSRDSAQSRDLVNPESSRAEGGTGEALGQNPTAQDAEYMAAVESGDVAKQQAMVDAAAKRAGYTRRVFHGTTEGGFQHFDPEQTSKKTGFVYFSTGKGTAASYSGTRRELPSGSDGAGIWNLYLKEPEQVWDFEEAGWDGQKPDGSTNEWYEMGGIDGIAADAKRFGIQSFEVQNVLDEGPNGDTAWYDSTIAVSDPSLIKSADPITRDAEGNVIPLSKRFNHESNSILFQNPAPIDPTVANQGDTDENREAFARARGSYITNELTKANFEEIRQKVEEQIDEDEQGMLDNIQDKVANDEELSLEEEIARRMLANTLRTRGVRENDQAMVTLADSLWGQDIRDATETARKLAVRVDQFQSPQERLDAAMGRIIAPNRANLRERLTNVWTPSAKRREIARLEGEIAKAATAASRASLERTLAEAKARMDQNDLIDKMAAENREAVDKVLTRLGLTQADLSMTPDDRHSLQVGIMDSSTVKAHMVNLSPEVQKAIEMSVRGYADAAIVRDTGLSNEVVGRVTEHFRNEVAKKAVSQMVKVGRHTMGSIIEGGKNFLKWILGAPPAPLQGMVNAGVKNAANVQAQVQAILNAAIPTRRNRNRRALHAAVVNGKKGQKITVFVPYDPTDWQQVYRVARELSTRDATAMSKVYEYWINGILSGPQTHVVNTASNVLSTLWHYLPQFFASATVNSVIRDPNSTQWGEWPRVWAGFLKGIAPALKNFALAWRTEADPIEYQYLDRPVTVMFNDAAMEKAGGGRSPAIGGPVGRVIRIPGRFLVAMDAFAKTLIMHGEVSAQAYRLGKKRGLSGVALENFMASQIAVHGSESWEGALQTAKELTFQDENDITKTVEKLANAAKQAKYVGLLAKFLFPFIRTPTNIYRTGMRKAGGSAGILLWKLGQAGFYKMKEGRPFFDTYAKGKMVQDVSESVIAGILWFGLMAISEGDPEDEDRWITMTGTRPYGIANAGERTAQLEGEGGSNLIIIRKNPVTGAKLDKPIRIAYGRYEPLALTVGSIIDAAREFKEWTRLPAGDQTAGKLAGTIASHLASQAQDKTFLQGVSGIMDFFDKLTSGRYEPGQEAAKFLINGAIPNLIRQPLKMSGREILDSHKAHEILGSTNIGNALADGEAKITTGGKPVTRAGNQYLNVLFPGTTEPGKATFYAALKDWNTRHPGEKWNPDPITKGDWYIYDPAKGGTKGKFPLKDVRQISLFEKMVGNLFASKSAQALGKLGYRPGMKATPDMLDVIKKSHTDAIKQVRSMPPSAFIVKAK